MRFKTVSQHLLRPIDKLVFKLSVNLINPKTGQDGYYNIFEQPSANYLTFSPDAAIIFQYKDANGIYDASHIVRITDETLFQVNKSFQEFYKKLLRVDLFTYYKSGSIVCNPMRDDTKTISLKTGGFMELEPGVIADMNTNKSLPGVFMYLNIKENKIELSVDEFESIMYKLTKTDIGQCAMQMIIASQQIANRFERNTYSIPSKPSTQSNATKPAVTGSIFQKSAEMKKSDDVIDIRSVSKQPTSIDELLLDGLVPQ